LCVLKNTSKRYYEEFNSIEDIQIIIELQSGTFKIQSSESQLLKCWPPPYLFEETEHLQEMQRD